jgi:hypothetical protein
VRRRFLLLGFFFDRLVFVADLRKKEENKYIRNLTPKNDKLDIMKIKIMKTVTGIVKKSKIKLYKIERNKESNKMRRSPLCVCVCLCDGKKNLKKKINKNMKKQLCAFFSAKKIFKGFHVFFCQQRRFKI